MIEIDNVVREAAKYAEQFDIKLYLAFHPCLLNYELMLEYGNQIMKTFFECEEMEDFTEKEFYTTLCNYIDYMHDRYFLKEELDNDD